MQPKHGLVSVFIVEVIAGIVAIVFHEEAKFLFQNPYIWPIAMTVIGTSFLGTFAYWLIKREREKAITDFVNRTELHHRFVHVARDIMVRRLGPVSAAMKPNKRERVIPEYLKGEVQILLDTIAQVFTYLVPSGTKIFVSLRERRGQHFATILRAGTYNPNRHNQTTPLPVQTKMIKALLDSYQDKKDCVIITGSKHEFWEPLQSDKFKEDLSVIMGAVFSKTWDDVRKDFKPPKLEWIVCVCANKEGVFKDRHTPLMKCFNDLLSLLLNSFLRVGPPANGDDSKDADTENIT